jgi:hypothetical protein
MNEGKPKSPEAPTQVNVERAKKSPAEEFAQPDDVIRSDAISEADKEKILNQWEVDAQALSRAADEGMGGGEPTRLTSVQAARRKLRKEARKPVRDRRTSGKPAR